MYFNISSARFEKIEKSGVDKEIIKYLKNCQEYFNDFYTQSTDNVINFSAVYSIFTAILNKN
ncbi:hypothetical protein HOG21_00815 [bacterium]|nr:hypothetical protein [bacterium]